MPCRTIQDSLGGKGEMSRTGKMDVEQNVCITICPMCRREFILYAVFKNNDDGERLGEDRFYPQEGFEYCPFCGAKTGKSKADALPKKESV